MAEDNQNSHSRPWYKHPGIIIALIILFFPLGLALMWMHLDGNRSVKWTVTGVIGVVLVISLVTEAGYETTGPENNSQNASQEQENDSTASVKEIAKNVNNDLKDIKVAKSEDSEAVFVQARLEGGVNQYHYVEMHVADYVDIGENLFNSRGVEDFEMLYVRKNDEGKERQAMRTTMTAKQFDEIDWSNLGRKEVVSRIEEVTGNFRQSAAEFMKYEDYQTVGVKESINQDKGVFLFPIVSQRVSDYGKLNIMVN